MWEKLKEVLPNKQKIVANSLLSQHGEVVDDLADITDIFNEHFSTVGEHLVNNATPRGLADDNIHLTRINSLEGNTARYYRGVCSKANIINVGREGNWSGWNKCKNVANIIELFNESNITQNTANTRWSHLSITVEINVIQLTIALFPYCQLSPKSWSDGYIQ